MLDDRPPHVLIIDDNAQNVALITAQLRRAGYTVSAAATGRLGLEAARQGPDVILLDVLMPGLDGYEVCRHLKADEATRPIPVIMLTSLRDRSDKIRALEAGADDFLSKPVDRAELLARVRSLVRSKRLFDELARSRDEIARQAEQLGAEKSRAEAILYSISDGVFTTDPDGRVTMLNPAAEEITGTTFERAVGRIWSDALGVRDTSGQALSSDTCPLCTAARTGQPVAPRELSVRRPNGSSAVISVAASPVRRAGGEVSGIVAVFRDVTRQREAEHLKDELISLVSHELRTPLASIVGFSELLLLREPLSDTGRSCAETINREAQRLSTLINDFLDIERLESGRISYHFRSLPLQEVIEEVLDGLRTQLAGFRVACDLPGEPLIVRVDRARLAQVLINIISNAVKYSPGGGWIRIAARAERDVVIVSVSDTGLGIPGEAIPHLFEKFYRVDRTEHREIRGTGLGLAICRRIIEGWGGRIWAESAGPGQGSTFSFTLPHGTTASVPAAARELRRDPHGAAGERVLPRC